MSRIIVWIRKCFKVAARKASIKLKTRQTPPPLPPNFVPTNTKFWNRPCAAPLYTAVTLCKDPILVLHLYILLWHCARIRSWCCTSIHCCDTVQGSDPGAAPLYTAVTLCKDPILLLHLYTLLWHCARIRSCCCTSIHCCDTVQGSAPVLHLYTLLWHWWTSVFRLDRRTVSFSCEEY